MWCHVSMAVVFLPTQNFYTVSHTYFSPHKIFIQCHTLTTSWESMSAELLLCAGVWVYLEWLGASCAQIPTVKCVLFIRSLYQGVLKREIPSMYAGVSAEMEIAYV